jgi:hypothetical protein
MLTKGKFIKKLLKGDALEREDFIATDLIYYNQAVDIKAVLDFPIFHSHTCQDFRLLAIYYLHRCHNLRLLLQGCAEMKNCYNYVIDPVWVPDFFASKNFWNIVKDIEKGAQDPLDPHFQKDAETRIAVRHMLNDIQILLKEFKALYIFYRPFESDEGADRIITVSTVEKTTLHPRDCKNLNCEFK